MTNKIEVINTHKANPTWTAKQIAAALGCSPSYISACRHRYGLPIPLERTRPESVFDLGRAAQIAGFTVAKIQQLGAQK